MKQFSTFFGGILAVFALSFVGLVMIPQVQLGNLQPFVDEDAGDIYPINAGGEAAQGRHVYAANGCIYCHTQQVRDPYNGADILRKWGTRRTVARDYIYAEPALLGNMRNGPDLANIGTRKDEKDGFKYTQAWHYLHLYNPQLVSPGSSMPSFAYLFEKRKIVGERAIDALDLTGNDAPEAGYEVVPSAAARSLVALLLTLDHSHPLKEAGASAPEQPKAGAAAASPSPAAGAVTK